MKRLFFIKILLLFFMFVILVNLFVIQVVKNEYFQKEKNKITQKIVEGDTAPRGRIYDRNGVLLVDNKPKKVIYYKKDSNITKKEEIYIIKEFIKLVDLDDKKLTNKQLKDYYIYLNGSDGLLTLEEINEYNNRKITLKQKSSIIYERITEDMLKDINHKEAYLYFLMNNGYYYDDKIIKDTNVSNYEYATIAESLDKLKGFGIKLNWERQYLYDDTFKNILGRVGNVPIDRYDEYINKGYYKNDIVGISYIEYQYDDYLKGKKNKYLIKNNNKYLLEEGAKGNDLYLTIDISFQKQIEQIIINNLLLAKREQNTKYLNKAFVIIQNPRTGEIIAMAGKQIIDNKIYDFTSGIVTSSYVVGSTVKGASHIVGYNTGALKIGEVRDDSCIKIKATNQKCSWMYLGSLNDITALKYSSNTYQFRTAIKVAGGNYIYDNPLKLNNEAFNIYRDTYKEFGLGVKTQIDLPNEKLGYTGKSTNASLLLDFSIGQYDTYTPIQLSQYITTIANDGIRLKPYLLSKVMNGDKVIYETTKGELNNVTTSPIYINRVKEGFRQVLDIYGTGYNYVNPNYKPAGKTGTSESFIDTNLDGNIDTKTITTAFIGYMPYDNPLFSIAVISPDVSNYGNSNYVSPITKRIVREVSDIYFQR